MGLLDTLKAQMFGLNKLELTKYQKVEFKATENVVEPDGTRLQVNELRQNLLRSSLPETSTIEPKDLI